MAGKNSDEQKEYADSTHFGNLPRSYAVKIYPHE
jgi:hypothetical protein